MFQWVNLAKVKLGRLKKFHKAVLKTQLFTFPHWVTFTGQCLLTQRLPLRLEGFPLAGVSLSAVLKQSIQSTKKIVGILPFVSHDCSWRCSGLCSAGIGVKPGLR